MGLGCLKSYQSCSPEFSNAVGQHDLYGLLVSQLFTLNITIFRKLRRFLDEPQVRAQLLLTLGRLRTNLGDPRGAIPYIEKAEELARAQAQQLADVLHEKVGKVGLEPALPENVQDKEIIALIAYLQRLGTDLEK